MKTVIDQDKIKEAFEAQTGISATLVEEISEAYPVSLMAQLHTKDRSFVFRLTWGGRVVKGSFIEEK